MITRSEFGVVLTRPAGRARALAARLRQRGYAVAALPGSSIGPPPDPVAARAALITARAADVVVFLSPPAVAAAFTLAPSLAFDRRTRVLAPGPGTRAALRRRGLDAECPEVRYDSEGLLAMPVLTRPAGRRVVLVGAPGGRNLLARTLRDRGALVETIHGYARRPARLDRRHLEALAGLPAAVNSVWSSVDAIAHLSAGLPPAALDRLRRAVATASSERVATALRAHGFHRIVVAASARPADLVAAIEQVVASHRKATENTCRRPLARPTIR